MAAPHTPQLTVEAGFGNGPGDEAVTWVDLAAYNPRDLTVNRGRQNELERFNPAACSFELVDNTDRDLDPTNLSGPYVETATLDAEYPLYVGAVAIEAGTSLGTDNAQTLPTDTTVGELLIAYVTVDLNGGATGVSLGTGAAAWTELFDDANGTVVRHACYARIATGSDALVLTGSTEDYVVEIIRVGKHGCASTADIEVGTTATGSSATPDPPSLNAGSSQRWLWIAMAGIDTTTTTATTDVPSGFTTIDIEGSAVSTTSVGLAWAYKHDEVTTLNPGTFTVNATRSWVANTIAIPPATVTEDRTQIVPGTPIRVVADMGSALTVLNDPATGPALHTDWRVAEGSITAAISGSYTLPVGTVLEGMKGYNFDGPSSFQFGTAADGASPFHDVLIVLANQGYIGWNLNGTTLTYVVNDGSVSVDDTVTWNDTNHRYLRISFDGDDVLFERSADASSWTTIDTYTRGTDFDASVDWSYGHLRIANASTTTTPQFDDFIVTASHYTRFVGSLDTWDYRPLGGNQGATVAVSATDAFARFANIPLRTEWRKALLEYDPSWFYDLGEEFGTVAYDSSGHGLNTYVAPHIVERGADPVRPLLGSKGVRFAPASTLNGIPVPDAGRITAIPYTWGAWVKVDYDLDLDGSVTQNLAARMIFVHASQTGSAFNLMVALKYGSLDADNLINSWNLSTVVTGSGITNGIVDYWSSLADGNPHMVAVTVDGSGVVKAYIDGQEAWPRATFSGFSGSIVGTWIGLDQPQLDTPTGYGFPGLVDDVFLIRGTALTYIQIRALYETAVTAYEGDNPGTRIGRVLDGLDWLGGHRRISAGQFALGPADVEGKKALAYLQDIELAEGGQLFIGRHGEVVFRGATEAFEQGTDPVLFDDAGSGVGILGEGFHLMQDPRLVYTTAQVSVPGGGGHYYENETAVARYGERGYSASLISLSGVEAVARAVGIVERYKNPLPRLDSFVVAPEKTPSGSRNQAWADVLHLELGDTIQVQFTLLDTGDTFDGYFDVSSISEQASGGAYVFTIGTTPRDPAYGEFFAFSDTGDTGFNYGMWR